MYICISISVWEQIYVCMHVLKIYRARTITLQNNSPKKKLYCPKNNPFYCIIDLGNFLKIIPKATLERS